MNEYTRSKLKELSSKSHPISYYINYNDNYLKNIIYSTKFGTVTRGQFDQTQYMSFFDTVPSEDGPVMIPRILYKQNEVIFPHISIQAETWLDKFLIRNFSLSDNRYDQSAVALQLPYNSLSCIDKYSLHVATENNCILISMPATGSLNEFTISMGITLIESMTYSYRAYLGHAK